MRLKSVLTAGLMLAGMGCSQEFLGNFGRNSAEEPLRITDAHVLRVRCEHWAEDAWKHLCNDNSDQVYSHYFRHGFKCGYVDYLIEGGKGNPPASPPFFYQQFGAFTDPGARNEATREWYAGFRLGASQAIESGLRNDIVIPLSAPPINAIDTKPTLAENEGSRQDAPPTPAKPKPADQTPPKPMGPANGIEALPKPTPKAEQP